MPKNQICVIPVWFSSIYTPHIFFNIVMMFVRRRGKFVCARIYTLLSDFYYMHISMLLFLGPEHGNLPREREKKVSRERERSKCDDIVVLVMPYDACCVRAITR